MSINFFRWLKGNEARQRSPTDISCKELFEAAQDLQIRELCFWTCVNMVANAMGRCEFRTFREGKEIQEKEYYLWNVSPNTNQNSTMFMHKLISKLYLNNEALVVNTLPRDGIDALVVADSWEQTEEWPSRQNEYRGVLVDNFQFQYPLYESQVLHFRLNQKNIRPVINALYQSYYKLISAAMRTYTWENGQHWKVHVSQIAQGQEDWANWAKNFQEMIQAQLKPFFESSGAILPEFDGYMYEQIKNGGSNNTTRDIRALVEDIFDFTARGMLMPPVLINGGVEGTADANARFLTNCIDPLCDQLQEEITRKRYGYDAWVRGDYIKVDSSAILHFDIFQNAANVEKLVGSGAYTINDVRRAANQPTINEPWANQHYMTLNIGTMSENTRKITNEEGGKKDEK